ETVKAAFQRGILDRQLTRDQPVGLFEPQGIHGADAERLDAERPAGVHYEVEDGVLHLDRVMQLPAELADEIDPQRSGLRAADIDESAAEPGEAVVGQ